MMGDWAHCYEAFGYDISHIKYSKPKRHKVKNKTISAKLSPDDYAKYMEPGGSVWLKSAIRALKREGK